MMADESQQNMGSVNKKLKNKYIFYNTTFTTLS